MEVHPEEGGCEGRSVWDMLPDESANNVLGFRAALGVEARLQLSFG